jgi:hypothetical protein
MLPRPIRPPDDVERYLLSLLAGEAAVPPDGAGSGFWARLLSLMAAHRLSPYLYARRESERWWRDWPAEPRRALQLSYLQTDARNARFRDELLRLLPALASRGVSPPVLLKGAALALVAYDHPAERPYGDIDLLVRPQDLDAAVAVLREGGYALDERFQSEAFYRACHYHLILRNRKHPWLCFEIHWDLSLPMMDTGLEAEAVLRRATPARLEGEPVLVPSSGDMLLHLSLHAALGSFGLLAQTLDVHQLVARHGADLDADELWHRARAWRVARPLRASLALAPLFGSEPQVNRLLAANPQPHVSWLANALLRPISLLRQRAPRSEAGATAVALWRRDALRDRWRFMARQFHPSAAELAMEGRPVPTDTAVNRLRQFGSGSSLLVRTSAWIALALAGLEVHPKGG